MKEEIVHLVSKVQKAEAAGALAVVVVNRDDGSQDNWTSAPITMGGDGGDDISIPSVMISANYANQIKNAIKSGTLTVSLAIETLADAGRTVSPGVFYINDVVVRDNDGTSEVIVAAGVSTHRDDSNHIFWS